ncbi:MAG: ABC transporter ATP-binding protein [Anaerolineaceae bacterium]|nr:ABC transporter ATP-binding protein [Anaerolineaceae bacterium]
MSYLLEFKDFSMGFKDDQGKVYNLLDRISFGVEEGKAVGIVGESGCGKSMTSLAVMGLLPPNAVIEGGEVVYKGQNLLGKSPSEMEDIRGKEIAMIFQEPMTSLNPVLTIGFQIGEMLARHQPELSKKQIEQAVIGQLDLVGIPSPKDRVRQYPHEFSGGMRQRAMIAMAHICGPNLLIADEPTTALDVTIQAQVLEVMIKLKEHGSLMLITHNLGIVAETCDRVVVMYAGRVVEQGTTADIFDAPSHPYTRGLMAAIPTLASDKSDLYTIPGTVPLSQDFETGCRFAPRCEFSRPECYDRIPPTCEIAPGHFVQCWLETNPQGAQDV